MSEQKDIYGVIYVITNLVNNKKYVGQTIRSFNERYRYGGTGIERVYKFHKYNKENGYYYNEKILKDIAEYGFESFEVNEKFDVAYSQKELYDLEDKYIKEFNCIYEGYNYDNGGCKHSIDTRNKISKSHIGILNSEESKKINSEKHKGELNNRATKIMCLNDNKVFNTLKECSEYYKISRSTIRRICCGETKHPLCGMYFIYYNNN